MTGPDSRVTVAGIAEMAGTGRSAVSNWRKRHDDFPEPVAGSGTSPEFALTEVEAWLTKHGRYRHKRQAETALWNALSNHRGELPVDRLVDITLSLLTWNHLASAAANRNPASEVLSESPDLTVDALLGWIRAAPTSYDSDFDLFAPLRDAPPRLLFDLLHAVAAAAIPSERAADVHYELLEQYRKSAGHRGDEWATSEALTEIVLACARPRRDDVIYDGAAGRGGFLRAAAQRTNNLQAVHGQEINRQTWLWAAQWLRLKGLPGRIDLGDTIREDLAEDIRADLVLTDPPYGLRLQGDSHLQHDRRWTYGLPGRTLDLVWLENAIAHLAPGGRAFVLLPTGSTFRGGAEGRLRAELLRAGTIEAVIALPPGLAGRTGLPLALWVVARPGETVDPSGVLLMNVGQDEVEPARIATSYYAWRDKGVIPKAGPDAASVAIVDLLGPDASILPARWLEPAGLDADPMDIVAGVGHCAEKVRDSLLQLTATAAVGTEGFRTREPQLRRTTIADLVDQQIISVRRGRPKPADSDLGDHGTPLATAADVRHPGKRAATQLREIVVGGDQLTEQGDVLVVTEGSIAAIVEETGGRLPIAPVHVLRVAKHWLDPHYLARVLVSDTNARLMVGGGIPRARPQDLEVALIAIAEQARLVAYLRQVEELQRRADELASAASDLRRAAVDATLAGALDIAPEAPVVPSAEDVSRAETPRRAAQSQ